MTDLPSSELTSFPYWQGAIEQARAGTFDKEAMGLAIDQVRDAFKARLADAQYWDGSTRPALGSPLYNDIKDALEFAVDIKPAPWSTAFRSWVLNDRHFDALIAATQANPERFNYDRFRGDFFELFGHALADGPDGQRLTSPEYQKDDPAHVRYVTMLADGSYQYLSTAEVTRLLRDPKGPHVIVSANHAFFESLDEDVKPLFEMYQSLYQHTNGLEGKELATLDKPDLATSDTVMIAALHTRENKYLNLAQLFHRVGEIEALHGDHTKDQFIYTAPIAIATTAMLLRTLVKKEEVDLIQPRRNAFDSPQFLTEGATVHITPEGIENLKRRIGQGFSKGGNDMRDAMRLLVHALDNPKVVLPSDVSLHDVMSQISLTVTALNEMRMADYYRAHGVRVTHISNGNDVIAPPQQKLYEHADPAYNYVGLEKWSGHAPSIAAEGIANDPRTCAHMNACFAGTNSKAALCGMHLVKSESSIDCNQLQLEVAPSTTDTMMQEAFRQWHEKLAAAGLPQVTLTQSKPFGTDRFCLQSTNDAPLVTTEHLTVVREALAESGIVTDLGVDEQLRAMKGALKISAKSGLPLNASEPLRTAERLVRIDNKLRHVPSEEPDAPPVTKVVTGSHSRITRNTMNPTMPASEGDSAARLHHNQIIQPTR